jgi:serine/threonine protein kinase
MKKCPKCGTEYPDTTTLCPSDGVALEKTGDALIGQTLAGKYRVEERLSEGGMGTVYRGTHILMDKTVAIKVLRPSLAADEKIVARFSREARAASRISHPHAVSVTDFGESEDGIVFLVMEYLRGKTLKQVIRQEGRLPLSRIVEIIRQVGGALDAAHSQGVVHRDLKSDNIMLLSTNGLDYAKVLDFGIAKIKEPAGAYDPGLTAPDLVIGTPQYMSPEQCSQSPGIDARSDIYSLGVILYEMLVGHVPFTGDAPTAIMLKHLQEPVPSLLNERTDVPAAVERVVLRAMAKLPDNRYQSVGEFVEDVTIAAGMEVSPVRSAVVTEFVAAPEGLLSEPDEETLVRPRPVMRLEPLPEVVQGQTLPPPASLNTWRILIPSLAGLLVVFAVVYAFTRKSELTNTNQTQPMLVADPNSQPVEPVQPATGKSEAGIPAGGAIANPVNANAATNASPTVSPSPVESEDANINANANGNENSNKANANNNRPATSVPLPSPSGQINTNEQPAAAPSATKSPSPKPTLPSPNVPPVGPAR